MAARMGHEIKLKRRHGRETNDGSSVAGQDRDASSASSRLLPWIAGAIAFLIYLRTMTPGMQMGDGTELAAAAQVLGVPHPTGYPLYMLLTKIWLLATVAGDAIVSTTMLNAVLMSASVGLTAVILADLLRAIWKTDFDKALLIWAAAGALTVAFLRFHWINAVVTEVYALQFFLTVAFTRLIQKLELAGAKRQRRYLLWATGLFALTLAHHRLSVTLVLPWIAIWVWVYKRPSKSTLASTTEHRALPNRRLPYIPALLILTAGLSLYAYLPIRAAVDPPINWGNPDSISRFYNHVRGTEYLDRGLLKPALGQSFSAETLALFMRLQTTQLLSDLTTQFAPFPEEIAALPGAQKVFVKSSGLVILLGLGLAGIAVWGALKIWDAGYRLTVCAAAAVAVQNLLILYVYNIVDIRDYFLYPLWAAWIGVFALIAWAARRLSPDRQLFVSYALLLLPVGVLSGNWHRSDRSDDISAEVLSSVILPETLDVMPLNSILITDDDSETFTTWYRQMVRGDRPDVLNFAGNFVYMPWYKTFFSQEQIRDYKIQLAPTVAQNAAEYAGQLRDGIIDENIDRHPIFTSINDGTVLSILQQTYAVEPVDAVGTTNRGLFDIETTTVLYRIQVKDQEQ